MVTDDKRKNLVELTWTKIVLGILLTVTVSSLITWGLIDGLATPKTAFTTDTNSSVNTIDHINGLVNTIDHMKDSATSLNSFTGYVNNRVDTLTDSTQTHFDEVEGRMTNDETNIDTKASTADLNSFKNSVNNTLVTKANSSDLVALQNTVSTKANSSDLAALQNTVSTKANSSDLVTLQNTLNGLTITIPSGAINANNCANRFIWTADVPYQVTSIVFQQSVVEATNSGTTITVERDPNGTAIGSGYSLLTTAINLSSGITANVSFLATLNSATSNLQFAAGDSLALNFSGLLKEYIGCVTVTLKRM